MTPFIAHAADWTYTVMFLGPTLLFIGFLVVTTRQERKRNRLKSEAEPPPATDQED